ncbi:ATP-binding protein [Pseudoduganella namucuonensis]|uniref:Serine/threonine-protein kinase RsbT n=1 Tax=Pseudoduganella namucuonensis TaxID=1035707 RepID=A0A1I7HEE9_9BURK|nr:ATP-binding protein [Pseudoduganella namucuonensis]SFU59067.1 serine/threonine-protein kinase RsbT [Pseudoduganella namucuonensis]
MSVADEGALVLPLRADEDVVRLRKTVREHLVNLGFSLIDQTKMVTAASELARNTLRYGGGGDARLERLQNGIRAGLALSFIDQGPGIADLALALKDGYTTGGGMGLGLSGAKRLADEFDIASAPGAGTTVRIAKWKPY